MRLRFGIVGGGGGDIGHVHIRGSRLDDMCDLTAGCFSRNKNRNAETAKKWGIEDTSRIYPDYKTMVEAESKIPPDDRLHFIVIVTPNNTHYEISKAFMEKGFHIFCEKPLAMTVEEGEELARIAKENGLLFGLAHAFSGYAMIRQIREMIENGDIGNINFINIEYPEEWLALALQDENYAKTLWRLDPDIVGPALTTADIGTHSEHLIKAATGLVPKRVMAKLDRIPSNLKVDSNACIIVDYGKGITGLIWVSQVAIGHGCDLKLRVFGDKGAVEWELQDAGKLKVTKLGGPPMYYSANSPYLYPESRRISRTNPSNPEGQFEAFGNLYRSFCEILSAKIKGYEPDTFVYPTVEDGVEGMKFVKACLQSDANNNIWVNVFD